eukprot:COSAG02_NODE_356_length_23978_cov_7.868504_7_plen_80_part_00
MLCSRSRPSKCHQGTHGEERGFQLISKIMTQGTQMSSPEKRDSHARTTSTIRVAPRTGAIGRLPPAWQSQSPQPASQSQ